MLPHPTNAPVPSRPVPPPRAGIPSLSRSASVKALFSVPVLALALPAANAPRSNLTAQVPSNDSAVLSRFAFADR
jgi:hypothetical protein